MRNINRRLEHHLKIYLDCANTAMENHNQTSSALHYTDVVT
jgi:hypothetical protein